MSPRRLKWAPASLAIGLSVAVLCLAACQSIGEPFDIQSSSLALANNNGDAELLIVTCKAETINTVITFGQGTRVGQTQTTVWTVALPAVAKGVVAIPLDPPPSYVKVTSGKATSMTVPLWIKSTDHDGDSIAVFDKQPSDGYAVANNRQQYILGQTTPMTIGEFASRAKDVCTNNF